MSTCHNVKSPMWLTWLMWEDIPSNVINSVATVFVFFSASQRTFYLGPRTLRSLGFTASWEKLRVLRTLKPVDWVISCGHMSVSKLLRQLASRSKLLKCSQISDVNFLLLFWTNFIDSCVCVCVLCVCVCLISELKVVIEI